MKSLKFIFSSLLSNQKITDESNEQPWWLAIVIALLSIVIAIIPTTVQVMTVQGSDIITRVENYSLDYSLTQFSIQYLNPESPAKATISDGKMTFTNFTDGAEIKHGDDVTLVVRYTQNSADLTTVTQSIKTSYPVKQEGETETDKLVSKIPSMLIFTEDSLYLYVYDASATATYTEKDGTKTIVSETNYVGVTSGTYEGITGDLANLNSYYNPSLEPSKAASECLNNWTTFFDKAYETPRNSLALSYTGMFAGLDAIIMLVLSLTIFLLSKTKSSIRRFKYLESLKMIFFASLSPAILSLLLGFLIPSLQSISFVLFIGLRCTWLAMKATSPQTSSTPTRK